MWLACFDHTNAGELASGALFVVTEYMAGGDLSNVLWGTKPLPWGVSAPQTPQVRLACASAGVSDDQTTLSLGTRLQYASDIAEGMAYLHSEGALHR